MPGVIFDQGVKARRPTKNEQRRAKKKQQKKEGGSQPPSSPRNNDVDIDDGANPATDPIVPSHDDNVEDELEASDIVMPSDDPLYNQFAGVFARFQEEGARDNPTAVTEPDNKPEVFYDDDDNIQDEDEEAETKQRLSKKARKAASRLSIAELKAIVRKPEIVEWTDISAHDPKLLVNLKSARNVVPVPPHWNLKREYLSSKRGIEKAGFALPAFIAETGISDMRDAVLEKQAETSLKQRQRERVQPKMGKLDIDYQKLYEAFFRRQTKPHLTRYGEVYYEGKEYETNLRHLRPGELSEELKEALNMPPGAPPPWLINQQKFGPPPSYPAMKIVGLNTALPPGAQWGFGPGEFGKPPLKDDKTPMWGGNLIFGIEDVKPQEDVKVEEPVDKSLWGELQPYQEPEEDEEEEDESDDNDEDADGNAGQKKAARGAAGLETPLFPGGTDTPGGIISTVPTDFAHGSVSMAGEFNLRKQQRRGTETEESHHPRAAGRVLPERAIQVEGFFGGERAYDLKGPSSSAAAQRGAAAVVPVLGQEQQRGSKRKAGDLDVSVDVDALEREDRLSKDQVRRQYEEQQRTGGGGGGGATGGGWQGSVDQDDLSQMIAEESAKRRKRDAERKGGGGRR